jgi:predicted Zn-dependent peptidase
MGASRASLPEPGPNPRFSFPSIVRHTLANGLEIRTVEHFSVPVTAFVLLVRGGLGADPAGREGLVSLTADMVDEGTGELSAIGVSDAMARIGGDFDIEVGADASVFSLVTLERFSARGAQLLASIATAPALRAEDFERVRRQRINRLAQLRTVPQALAERTFDRLLYGAHPYGHMAIGSREALTAMELDEVRQFHLTSYRPERCTLVVVGALPHEALLERASAAFGAWEPTPSLGTVQSAADVEAPFAPLFPRAIVPREGSAQSELRIGHLAARRDTPDYSPLLVMNAVLGGQFASRLNLKLREEKGFTYGAYSGFDWRRGLGPFSVETSVHTAATAEAIGDTLAELRDIRGVRPPSEDELVLAKASLTRGYPRGFETAEQVARSVASLALHSLPETYFEEFTPKIDRVTTEDVVDVASRYIRPDNLAILIVGDRDAIAASLEGLALGDWQEMPAEL